MKSLLKIFIICFITVTFAQSKLKTDKLSVNNLKIELKVDSKKDIKAFKLSDIKEALNMVDPNSEIEFKLTCNLLNDNSDLSKSYTVKGNSDHIDEFLKLVNKLKKSAKKLYKNN